MRSQNGLSKEEQSEGGTDEQVVDQFMQGSLRASRLAELCDALRLRISALREELKRTPASPAREELKTRITETRRQLAILKQEHAISQFVEDSVRATLRDQPGDPDEELLDLE